MATVLLTRPLAASQELAQKLTPLGYDCVVEPMLTIEALKNPPPPGKFDAVMITSGYALEAGQRLGVFLGLPCFGVGPRTAAKAHAAGFHDVQSAASDGIELASLIGDRLGEPQEGQGAILHICGRDIASGAQQELLHRGYAVAGWPVYAAHPASSLSEASAALLRQGKIDVVTVFSARTAQTLVALLQGTALEACCKGLVAIGLSEAVADVLRPLAWKTLASATAPTEEAVIDSLKQICPVSGVPDDRRRQTAF